LCLSLTKDSFFFSVCEVRIALSTMFILIRPLIDELVTVYIVLRTPAFGEKDLKTHLARLSITVEAHAIGQQFLKPVDGSNQPQVREAKELLASETVSISDDPLICATEIQAEGESEPSHHIYIFWKVVIPIGRPKGRLQKLAIFFTPMAVLKPFPSSSQQRNSEVEDAYLPSNTPLTMNILQPLASDPSLGGVTPFLSASRFSKTQSSQSTKTQLPPLSRPIRGGPRKLFRAAPAFLWRIRFLRYPALAEKDAMLACFDVEISQFANCPVSLDKIVMQLSSGNAEPVGKELPLVGNPGEQMTLIYKIFPPSDGSKSHGIFDPIRAVDFISGRTLTATISGTILMSGDCTPKVKIKWKTALEMPSSRPTSRADAGQPSTWSQNTNQTTFGNDVLTGQIQDVEVGLPIPNGVSVSITAPTNVRVGELFRWEVLVINRSDHVQRFAIVPIPRRKIFGEQWGHQNVNGMRPGSSGSLAVGRKQNTKKDVAAPWVDENVLYSVQKNALMESSDLICLSPDVRIGYVTCHVWGWVY
jgi:hypothetical protein